MNDKIESLLAEVENYRQQQVYILLLPCIMCNVRVDEREW